MSILLFRFYQQNRKKDSERQLDFIQPSNYHCHYSEIKYQNKSKETDEYETEKEPVDRNTVNVRKL